MLKLALLIFASVQWISLTAIEQNSMDLKVNVARNTIVQLSSVAKNSRRRHISTCCGKTKCIGNKTKTSLTYAQITTVATRSTINRGLFEKCYDVKCVAKEEFINNCTMKLYDSDNKCYASDGTYKRSSVGMLFFSNSNKKAFLRSWKDAAAECCWRGLQLVSLEDPLILQSIVTEGLQKDIASKGIWVNAEVESVTGSVRWCPKDGQQPKRQNQTSQCAALQLVNGEGRVTGRHCTEMKGYACIVRHHFRVCDIQ